MPKDGAIMTDAEKVQAQSDWVRAQLTALQSSMATLTTAVNLTANNTLIAKMTAANADFTALQERMAYGVDLLSGIFNIDLHPSGGDGCSRSKAPSIP